MKEDPQKKIEVPFEAMLKALLAKSQVTASDDKALQEAQRKGRHTFDKILTDALSFCNADLLESGSPRAKRCSTMKKHLRSL